MCTGKRQTHIRNAPTSRTAVTGIEPYNEIWQCIRIRRKSCKFRNLCRMTSPTRLRRATAPFRGGFFAAHMPKAPLGHKGPIPPIRGKWPEGPKGVGTLSAKHLRGFERYKLRCTLNSAADPLRHFLRKCRHPFPRGARQGVALSCQIFFLSGSRFVMLFKLMASVDSLCRRAEVVGGRSPATPKTMRPRLKPTMKR